MSQQLQITGGAKVRSLEGVITGSTGVLGSLPINGANGIPQLDSNGKILVSQLPNSVMEYKGTWNVTTNTPYLVNGTGNTGDVYLVEGAATGGTSHDFGAGAITFYNGDQVIYSGSIWQRGAGSSGTVTSVAITESGDALTITGSPITNSGTINIGFAGTSAQYVAGNGALVTFPALTGYVPYTGATATLDMGSFDVNARGFKVNGTAGNGHIDFKHQSGIPTGSASSTTLYADTNGDIAWKNDHLYITTFDSHSNTADRIYTLPNASGTVALTSDLSAYVPTSRTLTINGVTYDLSANRTWTITAGVSGSGTTNYISKWTGSTALGDSLLFDNGTNVGIGTASPSYKLDVNGTGRYSGALLVNPSNTAVVGLDVATSTTRFRADSTVTTNPKFFSISTGSGTAVLFDVGGYGAYANTDMAFYTQNASTGPNSTPNLYLKSDGTVGIGTSTPTNKLSVAGTAAISGQLTLGSTITNGTYTYTLPGGTGVLALTSDLTIYVTLGTLQTITGTKIYSSLQYFDNNVYIKHGISGSSAGYTTLGASASGLNINLASGTSNNSLLFASTSASNTYTFPNATGTIALTTDLSSYVPTSRTLTINGTTYDLSANRSWTVSGSQWTTSGSNIYYNTGNVGISTTSPTQLLQVGTGTTSSIPSWIKIASVDNSTLTGVGAVYNNKAMYMFISSTKAKIDAYDYGAGAALPFYIGGNGGNVLLVAEGGGGNVGIGTSSTYSTARLQVNTGTNKNLAVQTGTTDTTGIKLNAFNDAADTNIPIEINGSITILKTAETERMRITSGGDVCIGSTSSVGRLNVEGLQGIYYSSSGRGNRQIYFGSGGDLLFYNSSNYGYLSAAGAWVNASDISIKKQIIDIKYNISDLMKLKPRSYKMKVGNKEEIGFIAQEVEEVIPELVNDALGTGIKGLNYGNMVSLLVKAIQELKAEIDELKNK